MLLLLPIKSKLLGVNAAFMERQERVVQSLKHQNIQKFPDIPQELKDMFQGFRDVTKELVGTAECQQIQRLQIINQACNSLGIGKNFVDYSY